MAETKPAAKRRKNIWTGFIIPAFALTLFFALFAARIFVARPYRIPSASMQPNLHVGDYILTWNAPMKDGVADVHVGDVVVQRMEDGASSGDYIRRVLALPGQRIAFKDGVPILDGQRAVQENSGFSTSGEEGTARVMRETLAGRTYLVEYDETSSVLRLREASEIAVPPGMVYLVGDARDNANDSRRLGPMPLASVHHPGGVVLFGSGDNGIGRPIE